MYIDVYCQLNWMIYLEFPVSEQTYYFFFKFISCINYYSNIYNEHASLKDVL